MGKLREYRAVVLSGLAVTAVLAAVYFWAWKAEETDSRFAYAEHLFREGAVNEIDIQIAEEDWQDILENPLAEEYHRANTHKGEHQSDVCSFFRFRPLQFQAGF